MKSRASALAALVLAGLAGSAGAQQGAPADFQPSTGERPGEVRHDEVGYALIEAAAPAGAGGLGVGHAGLPIGSHAEVTALDSGKTVLVRIDRHWAGARGQVVALTLAVAQALGLPPGAAAPVRVRAVRPNPADAAALASGRPATPRADAPPALLAALRRKLPTGNAPTMAASRPAAKSAAPPPAMPAARGAYSVQVAALSSAVRARAVADRLGGHVVPIGALHRIQLGPFASAAEAEAARARARQMGFGDARLFPSN